MYNFVSFILVLVTTAAVMGDFPAEVTRCGSTDSACLKKSFQDVMNNYYNGLREIDLIPFDPLRIKSLILPRNPSSAVNLELKFTDLDVFGLKSANVKGVKGLNFKERGFVEFVVPELILKGKYLLDGNVLILPIKGSGDFIINGTNVIFRYAFNFKPIDKNGETFAQLEHVKLEMKPELFQFNFDNLFNGDKTLGDNMNKFLNENWREIYSEIEGGITKALSLIIKKMISNVLYKTPYNVLFPE